MKDDIYYGNLKGLLAKGRWSLNLEEASALVSLYQETEKRMKPMAIKDPEPIKTVKKKAAKK